MATEDEVKEKLEDLSKRVTPEGKISARTMSAAALWSFDHAKACNYPKVMSSFSSIGRDIAHLSATERPDVIENAIDIRDDAASVVKNILKEKCGCG